MIRSVLASVIFVGLTAAPAFAEHGSGSITALVIDPPGPDDSLCRDRSRRCFQERGGTVMGSMRALGNQHIWMSTRMPGCQEGDRCWVVFEEGRP